MQLHLPIFPADCTMISDTVGCYKKDGLIQYIVNGLPVYAHAESDLASFRFITSNFISQKLCRKSEIKANFHVSEDGIDRYLGSAEYVSKSLGHPNHVGLPDIVYR